MGLKPECRELPSLEFQQLLDRCVGNLDFAERLLTKFEDQLDAELAQLEQLLRGENTHELASRAHTLKGAAATVGATALRAAAADVEAFARENQLDLIASRLSDLQMERSRFADTVADLNERSNPC
jgi:HPt (histidine-containing phosphotransfer) domain-containing protein